MVSRALRQHIRDFRLDRSIPIAAAASLALGLLGRPRAALGVWIGIALFAGNVWLLHELARSLVEGRSARAARGMAIGSSVGRLLFLGVALSLVGTYLGREALLGACGALFVAQVHLTVLTGRSREAV